MRGVNTNPKRGLTGRDKAESVYNFNGGAWVF
jgi:hypothetical protein